MQQRKVIIIGSGPAGFTAAIYASRANLSPLLFEGFYSGTPGGQLMTTTEVENYPGFPEGIDGPSLMMQFRKQAQRFGTEILSEDVLEVDLSKRPFRVKGKQNECLAEALIIATGATAKRLDVQGTRDGEYWQKGVSACAICDGAAPIFRNRPLFVVGGGDTACEEANFLTKFGSTVYVVHRRDELRASKILAERIMRNPKIRILWNRVVDLVGGDKVIQHVVLKDIKTGKQERHEAGGLFFAIGFTPNTAFLNKQLALEPNGYIKIQPGTSLTSVEGVFAAGDVQDHMYRQAVTAAGSGCMAALDAERWLSAQE